MTKTVLKNIHLQKKFGFSNHGKRQFDRIFSEVGYSTMVFVLIYSTFTRFFRLVDFLSGSHTFPYFLESFGTELCKNARDFLKIKMQLLQAFFRE